MNSHELCPSCKPIGRCIFEVAAGFVTDEVFFAKTQTPIAPGEKIIETDHVVASVDQPLAQMGAEKPGPAGNQNAFE